MTNLSVAFEAFHLLRPLWLLALLPIAGLWWAVRSAMTGRTPPTDGLAPHLRAALTVGAATRRRVLPIDLVVVVLTLLALGAAGPTWSRQPNPFVAQSAPLVVALEVTPSMEETDVAPSRLERGKQKIRDLLELRAGARTALVAYAGTAHVAVPMTEDPGVMLPYLTGLVPDVMPRDGTNAGEALTLAQSLLARESSPGVVLFVADGIDPADTAAISDARSMVLAVLPEEVGDRGIDALANVPVIELTPDAGDVTQIDRMLDAEQARALLEDDQQPWQDRGALLAWPAVLLTLLWFRRGWTMRWAVLAALALMLPAPQARADGIADWFFTPDQQGRLAFERNDFGRAAELFVDPLWRGYALYRDGQYEEAVEVLDRVETAEASFIQGMAYIKSRSYREGVRAFETTLERDPDYPGAEENLATANEIVEYVETAQEQSDTGEDMGIGADEVVFDNESNRGAETQMEVAEDSGPGMLTTEQWMNTVDTSTGDFLRSRFALEAAQETGEAAADGGPANETGMDGATE
ncbi:VWA domain-containing protein [Pseudoruegeria sp. HB172150]|uniref:vWA domain-containing protein n=1 Tax=Pseudoruegeria sp. HB172150 TaxID=2721164 RepID=UPI0015546478|nr:VWA domain-containing protein [Pseudoruegeria sp. HB172150]